ncbi:ArsR/SmtB family transcription factor [Streptomyces platensis]|uniref:ArsR/SmtB family transcription factor n=1 Tax=Streptomyces platensis TaxID=58346 RepID=UPI003866B4FB
MSGAGGARGAVAGRSGLCVSRGTSQLREAGLVQVRQDAQRRWYELRPEPLAELDAWLAHYRHLWTGRLDAPPANAGRCPQERHLDAMEDDPR